MSSELTISFLTIFACLLFIIMVLVLFRVVKGPTAIDRIVATNIIGTKTTILLVVIGMIYSRADMFVDFAITYAMLNYIGSIAAARFYHKKHIRAEEEMPHEEAKHGHHWT